MTSGNKYKSIYSIWRSRGFFFGTEPQKGYLLVNKLPAPSRWGFKQSATQPSCLGVFPWFFLSHIREVGSIDPLLEGTGDQSMGCLVMHPDEADLTAGVRFQKSTKFRNRKISVNLGDVFFFSEECRGVFFQEVFRMLVNDSD